MALYASQGALGNGTEPHGWVWLMQHLEPPCYQIYIPLYQGNHTPRPKHFHLRNNYWILPEIETCLSILLICYTLWHKGLDTVPTDAIGNVLSSGKLFDS